MAKNRISHNVDPKDVLEFKNALAAMIAIGRRMLENTTPSDKTGQAMGDEGGWQYAQKCHQIAVERGAEMFTALEFNRGHYDRDILLAQTAFEYRSGLNQVDEMVHSVLQLVGRDLMEQSNAVRHRLELLAESHAEYKALFEEVNFFYENRGRKSGDAARGGGNAEVSIHRRCLLPCK